MEQGAIGPGGDVGADKGCPLLPNSAAQSRQSPGRRVQNLRGTLHGAALAIPQCLQGVRPIDRRRILPLHRRELLELLFDAWERAQFVA